MSKEELALTSKKYIASSVGQNNTSKIGKTSKNLEDEEAKRTIKYKFQYSNINETNHQNKFKSNFNNKNNFKKLKENLNINSTNNNYIDNTKYMLEEILEKSDNDVNKRNKFDNDENHINTSNSTHMNKKKILSTEAQSNESPSKLNFNYETNYSINNLVNVKYINGSNKNIYQKSYIRTPDIKYRAYKNKQNISKTDNSNIILEENNSHTDNYLDDANSDCTFRKRKYNRHCSYEENKIETSEEKDSINNENNKNNLNYNYLNNKRKIINTKYYEFGHNTNMRNIKNVRYNGRIIKVETIPIIFSNEEKNKKNKKIIKRNNSSDVITNRSTKISKYSKINTKYGKSKKLRNINKVENIRINKMNNMNNMDNLHLCRCKRNYNIGRNNQSFDKKDLRIQNAQNMQVIQDEMLRILIPIPPNKIDYACDLEIYGKAKKKYTLEEINKIKRKKKITEENELIKRKEEENNKMKNIRIKKPNWNLTNEVIKADINNKEFHEIKIIKEKKRKMQKMNKKDNMNQYNIENFNFTISDDGRKFRGEMLIEKNKLELEKQVKDPNSNLLISPNEVISYNADYPRKNWNNIIKPINGRSLSIKSKHKKVLIERSVEKFSFKGNTKPSNDWNIFNNAKKEININLYQKKKKQNLSKQRIQPIAINGKKKNWNNLTTKKNESKLTIRGNKKKKKKENEKDHEEEEDEVIFNNDYNKIKESKKRSILLNIKKEKEKPDESMNSEIDVLKKINICNGQLDQYKNIIMDSSKSSGYPKQKTIINDISRKYPKRIETYQRNDENKNNKCEIMQVIEDKKINYINILENPPNEQKSSYQKIIIAYQDNEINNNNNISYSQLVQQSPQKKYYYRERITNNIMQLNSLNDPMQNNIEVEEQNDKYSNYQSDAQTSNSEFKRSYREEIIINEFNSLNK